MSKCLVCYNEDEAFFRRPVAERIWLGSLFAFVTCLLSLGAADTFRGSAAQRDQLPLYFIMLFVFIFALGLTVGPNEMRFDFRRRRYRGKLGFLFLAWTRTGDVSEISHLCVWDLTKFTGLTIEWKNTKRPQTSFFSCGTGSEAQALAERLGISLGVPVKAGLPRYIKKPVR